MGHLLTAYSNYLGVTPTERPILNEKFFPLPQSKYIVVHNDRKLQSKFYEYFEEVCSLLRPILHKAGYQICQVGGPNDPHIQGVDHRFLGLSWGQSTFIIKNSSLLIGIDSVCGHIASAYNIPTISLFAHIYASQAKPAWTDKLICLEPEWGDQKPSYSAVENPKMIRTIRVEKIVQSAFNLLEIDVKLDMKTLFVGDHYHEPVFEVVPDFFTDSPDLKNHTIHFRMDLRNDHQCLAAWLSRNYKVNIITNQLLDLNLLRQFKQNIARVTLFMKDDKIYSPQYLKDLKALGVPLVLICDDDKNLSFLREKYFDFIIEQDDAAKPVENLPPDTKFWTKKTILSRGKKFPSIPHWRKNLSLTVENTVIDCEEFWKDKESFYFYK